MKEVSFLHDADLSFKAKGLLSTMKQLEKPLVLEQLLNLSKDGYTSIQRGLHELIANGYYYSCPIRNSKGIYIEFKQKVRFIVRKPEFFSEKEIMRIILSPQKLSDSDIFIINKELNILSFDEKNYRELHKEIIELANLGIENAKRVISFI